MIRVEPSCIGIMEKKMETTILWGYIGDILGLYRDNGKNGSYYIIIGVYIGVRVPLK